MFDKTWEEFIIMDSMKEWMPLLDSSFSTGLFFSNKKEGRQNFYLRTKRLVNLIFRIILYQKMSLTQN